MNPGITNLILIRPKINFITRTSIFTLTKVEEQKEPDIRDQQSLDNKFDLDHFKNQFEKSYPLL